MVSKNRNENSNVETIFWVTVTLKFYLLSVNNVLIMQRFQSQQYVGAVKSGGVLLKASQVGQVEEEFTSVTIV